MGVRDTISYDPYTLRKHFKNIGRAYREQATTLIEMCRLYVDASPGTYTKDKRLQNILRLADAALSAAGRANNGTTSEAAEAFLRVEEEMRLVGSPLPGHAPGPHRKKLPDLKSAMAAAAKKDEMSTGFIEKVNSRFPTPNSKGPIKKVNFMILKSPHERHTDQIIHQEIDNSTTTLEIKWRFSRCPENSPERISLKHNPHFYLELPEDAASYGSKFHKDPLKDFAYRRTDTVYILLDKSSRLFLNTADSRMSHIFGNLWRPYQKVILKDIVGSLDSEDIVSRNIGKSQDYWYRLSKVVDPFQHRVELGYSRVDSIIVQKPVGNWRAVVGSALRSQRVDLMIRDQSMPEPSTEWKRLPSNTYRQPEPTNTRTSIQPRDSSKDLRVKIPIDDILRNSILAAPASYSMSVPSPLSEPEVRSANPVERKGRRKMFDAYVIQGT